MKKNNILLCLAFGLFFSMSLQAQVNDNGTNVGIGIAAPPVAVGTATNIKLDVDGGIRTGIKGTVVAQQFTSTSNFSTTNSTTSGYLGLSSNWSAQSTSYGVFGNANVTTVRAPYTSKTGRALGGFFIADVDNVSGPGTLNIGGVHGLLRGTWNGTSLSNPNGNSFAAAVAGVDNINGAATYAGYFQGRVNVSGKVGIGTTNFPTTIGGSNISNYKLFVQGGILTEEVRVRTGWADYVFEETYDLKPLNQVEKYIEQNGHLPNVPSAKTVEDEGIEIGDITRIQQEKIEELFLHLIEVSKRLETLEKENETLKANLANADK